MKRKADEEPPFEREALSKKSWLDFGSLPDALVTKVSFDALWDSHPLVRSKVMIRGSLVEIPRWQQSFLQNYTFSGVEAVAKPLPSLFAPFLDWANALEYGEFNQVLVNWYENGKNYIGSHSDDEKQLVPCSPIVTITLCKPTESIPRVFRLRDRSKKIVRDVPTPNAMVLVMGGECQREFKHEIVKVSGKKAEQVGPRISITLRQFVVK